MPDPIDTEAEPKRSRKGRPSYPTTVCILDGPTTCPNDPEFDHDNYFGCVPKTFSPVTGRAKGYRQTEHDGRWYWNGGCAKRQLDALLEVSDA